MRAVWYDRQGPASEVMVTGELPTPEPGDRSDAGPAGGVRGEPFGHISAARRGASRISPGHPEQRRCGGDGQGWRWRAGAVGRQTGLAVQRTAQRTLDGHGRGVYRSGRGPRHRTAGPCVVRRGCHAGYSMHDSAWLRVRGRFGAGQDAADHRRGRRGRALCRATRGLGWGRGHRHRQFAGQGRLAPRPEGRHMW